MNFSAVILAGGKSSRMGRDKARLEINGQTLLARQTALVRAAGAREVFISGRAGADYYEFGCPVLRDRFSDAGPLAGIERALAAAAWPLLLVLAVDLPGMRLELLLRLAADCRENAGAVPRVAGCIEPLAAFYPKSAWPLAESLLNKNSNAMKPFAEQCVQFGWARFIDLPPDAAGLFANWNSAADLPVAGHAGSIRTGSPRRTMPP